MSTKTTKKKTDPAQEAAEAQFLDELTQLSIKRRAELDAYEENRRREEAKAARATLKKAQFRKYLVNTIAPVVAFGVVRFLYELGSVSRGFGLVAFWIALVYITGNTVAYATRNMKRQRKGCQA